MDLGASISTPTTTTTPKSPEQESETPTRIHPAKPISFSNGVLKRHHPHHHHHQHPPVVITYKECLKNHAASIGGHAVDGCGEFMPSPASNPSDPTSLKCAACGCHRNFHRREPDDPPLPPAGNTTATIEYQPHHRHHPPHPPAPNRSPNSSSPPPISSSYYPSAPHMLLALSGGLAAPPENTHLQVGGPNFSSGGVALTNPTSNSKKRFRTKFSSIQKEKMFQFAEKVGWKLQKRDDDLLQDFCREIEVDRGVLKVWMHNNKNTFAKKDYAATAIGNGGRHGVEDRQNGGGLQNLNHHFDSDAIAHTAGTNGSSSSS